MRESDLLCQLCQLHQAIDNSHIVPRFVSQWLKETSSLSGLRDPEKPNLRQEDTAKIPLLCLSCENRLSSTEGIFAKEIFLPFSDRGLLEFSYAPWLLDFAVGLSWRAAHSLLENLQTRNPNIVPLIGDALHIWGDFLLGNRQNTKPYAHHLFFDTMFSSRLFVGYAYDYRYAHRTIECAIPYGDNDAAIYVKLPGMVFYSPINPSNPKGFEGTHILSNGVLKATKQKVTNTFFWEQMQDSAARLALSMAAMSEKQKVKLNERMKTAKPDWQIRREREEK